MNIQLFEEKQVRTLWDADRGKWYISIVDVISILTESVDPNAYWRKLKQRLKQEGNETVTNCHGLKMLAADGKMRMTDVADTEQLFRLIQSIRECWSNCVNFSKILLILLHPAFTPYPHKPPSAHRPYFSGAGKRCACCQLRLWEPH